MICISWRDITVVTQWMNSYIMKTQKNYIQRESRRKGEGRRMKERKRK
jgi:hypothetical protein